MSHKTEIAVSCALRVLLIDLEDALKGTESTLYQSILVAQRALAALQEDGPYVEVAWPTTEEIATLAASYDIKRLSR